MSNYQFIDAYSSVQTAASSVISGVAQAPFVIVVGSIQTVGTAVANQSVSGTVQISGTPSISGTVNIVGTTSVSGTVNINPASVSGTVGASIVGQLPAGTAVLGSVAVLQSTNPWNIAGSVASFQQGTVITSILSSIPSSVLVGASIFGQLPAGTAVLGSIAALQGTNPWIQTFSNSSILAVPVGSVVTTWQSPSIVGTYAEDAASANGDKGLLVLAVRNDTVSSLISPDLDYSAFATDSAGRTLTKPFSAEESRVEGYASLVSGSVTTLVGAAGAGLRNYITDLWFANTGSVATLITLKDGLGSILGYTIAPSGSGSNLPGLQTPIRTGANTTFDFQPSTAVSVLYATVKGFKAP